MAKNKTTTLKHRSTPGSIVTSIILHLFLILVALCVLYPLVYVVAAAFTPGKAIAAMGIIPFGKGFTFEHFEYLLTDSDYPNWFKNTLIVALSTSALTVIVCALGAYVFSRFNFTMRKPLLLSFLILQVFPSFVGMIAIYVIMLRVGGIDTLWGLVLVYVAGNVPYNTWMMKNFIDSLPKSIDEAARIDGASNAQIFFRIIFPLARPMLTFLAITSFTGPWMDYIFPKMVLRSRENQTLALGLFSFVTDKKSNYTWFAAGAIMVTIPFMIFFMLGQNMMIQSLSTAAVKE